VTLHPSWVGCGLVLGLSLLVASSVAVDRPMTRARPQPSQQPAQPPDPFEPLEMPSPPLQSDEPAAASQQSSQTPIVGRPPQAVNRRSAAPRQSTKSPSNQRKAASPQARSSSTNKSRGTKKETYVTIVPSDRRTKSTITLPRADEEPPPSAAPLGANPSYATVPQQAIPQQQIPQQEAAPTFTLDQLALRQKINRVLAHYRTRHLNTRDHNPWEVMHAFVAFNVDTQIRRGGPYGPPVSAIGWMLWGGRCKEQQMLFLEGGRPRAAEGVGVQGHPAQLLAILAQSGVSPQTPMRLEGKDFTLQDLIDEEMLDCREGIELTFKLISFAHYLPSDETWYNRDGELWSIPRIINQEIKAPVRGAACGGTHRLFGISYAYLVRQNEGKPLDGEFLRAHNHIAQYHRYARTLRNRDGSFSTKWFERPENRPDIDRKIQTTGHIAEWLILSLPDEELLEPGMTKTVDFLATSLLNEPYRAWSIGPMGHALHALLMYDERVFQPPLPPPAPEPLASREDQSAQPSASPSQSTEPVARRDESAAKPDAETDAQTSDKAAGTPHDDSSSDEATTTSPKDEPKSEPKNEPKVEPKDEPGSQDPDPPPAIEGPTFPGPR
jgi:hypothetical protein